MQLLESEVRCHNLSPSALFLKVDRHKAPPSSVWCWATEGSTVMLFEEKWPQTPTLINWLKNEEKTTIWPSPLLPSQAVWAAGCGFLEDASPSDPHTPTVSGRVPARHRGLCADATTCFQLDGWVFVHLNWGINSMRAIVWSWLAEADA